MLLGILLLATPSEAQRFGKNKVNYTPFEWQYLQTENFDIYYSEGGRDIALMASRFAEDSYASISKNWGYSPRNRVPLLIYNSHNDFSQTNVILSPIEEGVGGFTELFKNRVVVPWEGSFAKFRHVIHHELTHAMYFDLLYGGILDSIMGREYMFQLPLWFAEGLAEHESQYWSSEADMIIRDAIITGYLPQIQQIYGGYMVYKGGESFFKYLQEEYGNEDHWMAGDVLQSLLMTKDIEKSYKAVFGKSLEDLSKEWHRRLRSHHWPEVAGREISEDFALKLTDHRELQNYLNATPRFNPTGDRVAFLTDRNGYKEVMVMSAIDGKILNTVVRGEEAGDYEEMHWLRGGITWSPDGTMVAFATKAGERDAIHIRKADEGGYDSIITPEMDAIFTPDWSPDGTRILFCGIKDGALDLFTVNVETLEYTRLTNDYFDEAYPRWSPDGSKIAFASDRMETPYELKIKDITGEYDIFTMDADGSNVTRITTDTYNDLSPDWSADGDKLVFVSNRNGSANLFTADLNDLTVQPLTNLLTGAATPSWSPDNTKIAFTAFKEGGWDIYILKRPLKRNITFDDITPTTYRKETLLATPAPTDSSGIGTGNEVIVKDDGSGQALTMTILDSRPYEISFTPDMVNAFASYNTFYGFGGMGQLSLSDVMGNHRLGIAGNLMYSLEESDLFFSYLNLRRQTNYGFSLYHYKNYYRSYNYSIFSDRVYGGSLTLSRPFSKFSRQDLDVKYLRLDRNSYSYSGSSYYYDYYPTIFQKTKLEGVQTFSVETEFVNDTTLWNWTGPATGRRYRMNLEYAPAGTQSDISFTTLELDYRKYHRLSGKYTLVMRLSGGASFGDEPRMFFLGGTSNWMNARIARIPSYLETMQDLFFARYPFPLRGYRYYEEYGRRYFLTNVEFRYPFIDYLAFNWPLSIVLGNISGALFADAGAAWYKPVGYEEDTGEVIYDASFHGGGQDQSSGNVMLDDIKMSIGFGVRMNMGFAVVRLDTAWRTNLDEIEDKPFFSLSMGPEF
jgi:Tol biopolymer transport system component